jgi:ferritin
MLSKSVQAAINEQIRHEFASAYVYLSMSAFFQRASYPGFAKWARLQSREEVVHGMRLFDYLNARSGIVELQAVEKPPVDYTSPLAVFEQALDQEREVTALIHKLYEFVAEEKDYATQVALEWFISEQVEEESMMGEIVEQLRRVGDDRTGLLILDRELGARTPEEQA